jgi:hypothetical protein
MTLLAMMQQQEVTPLSSSSEYMQPTVSDWTDATGNLYDVFLRHFVAVGDAIHQSGDGGVALGRFKELDSLTKTMYAMAQDSSETAGVVWSRRLGIFQNAAEPQLWYR